MTTTQRMRVLCVFLTILQIGIARSASLSSSSSSSSSLLLSKMSKSHFLEEERLRVLLQLSGGSTAMASSSVTLIDGRGTVRRSALQSEVLMEEDATSFRSAVPVVAVFSALSVQEDDDDNSMVTMTREGDNVLLSLRRRGGGVLGPLEESRRRAATEALVATSRGGSIVLTGLSYTDCQIGLSESRRVSRSLVQIFAAAANGGSGSKTTLFLHIADDNNADGAVVGINESSIREDLQALYESVSIILQQGAHADDASDGDIDSDTLQSSSLPSFEDVFDLQITNQDSATVMSLAVEAASRTPYVPVSDGGGIFKAVASAVMDTYSRKLAFSSSSSATSSLLEDCSSRSATLAIVTCDEALGRHTNLARQRLSTWKSRVSRGLVVPNFGKVAEELMQRVMDGYDRDTLMAAGLLSVSSHRLQRREALREKVLVPALSTLFARQLTNLEVSTLKKFKTTLLRKLSSAPESLTDSDFGVSELRTAAFAFDTAAAELEVAALSLVKARASREMANKLHTTLQDFPDSPAAKLQRLKRVQRAASKSPPKRGGGKKKNAAQRAIDIGLDLVAMLRPDGFGNLQGFAGYQMGGNSLIVGLQNDADAPDVISAFGGVRPPLLRVQPKLKIDVEL